MEDEELETKTGSSERQTDQPKITQPIRRQVNIQTKICLLLNLEVGPSHNSTSEDKRLRYEEMK